MCQSTTDPPPRISLTASRSARSIDPSEKQFVPFLDKGITIPECWEEKPAPGADVRIVVSRINLYNHHAP